MFPAGLIVIWSGAIVDIPAGYIICDGNNETPDLRNNFVVGAGDTYPVDDTDGVIFHTHTFTSDGHDHTFPAGLDIQSGSPFNSTSNTQYATGTTNATANLPPYYALAYIMKT